MSSSARGPRAETGFLLAMLACLLGAILLLNSGVLETSYSGFAFMGMIPFAIGGLAAGAGLRVYSHYGCIMAPLLLFAIIFPIMHYTGAEGLICILMVLPLWLAAGLGGALATWLIHRRTLHRGNGPPGTRLQVVGLLAFPFAVLYAEEASPPQWQERSVVRSITIAAAPQEVWPLLVSIPGVTSSEGIATFTHDIAGIPRPTEARLISRNGQWVRAARWGKDIRFEEHVTRLVPDREIGWDFAFPDTSVQDYTDHHISPDGPLLKIARGGYRIEPLGEGRVRVTLSTTYRLRSRLGWYVELWGERLLGDVEDNVLAIIKSRAEGRGRRLPLGQCEAHHQACPDRHAQAAQG